MKLHCADMRMLIRIKIKIFRDMMHRLAGEEKQGQQYDE